MAQTYKGKHLSNNAWEVDFLLKRMKFKKVKNGEDSTWEFGLAFVFECFSIPLLIMIILSGFIIGVLEMFGIGEDAMFVTFFPISFWICLVFATFMGLLFAFNKNFRYEMFPKFNGWIASPFQTKRRINPKAIIDNKFIIPFDTCTRFKYKATKDYSLFLKNIRMINKYNGDDTDFLTVIEWTQKPKEGYMDVWY